VTTILTEYLVSAGLPISSRLATAICYGISSETQDLGREAAPADIAAYLEAFPLSDQRLLGRLRHPRRSISFLAALDQALRAARMVNGVIVCHLGALRAPDSAAELADMLAEVEDVEWVLCTGTYEGELVLSVRTGDRQANAGELLRDVVGEPSRAGGHGMLAGGSLELDQDEDPADLHAHIAERFLRALGRDGDAVLRPLMEQPGAPKEDGSKAKLGGTT
jgi:nanoRNase/pAp phosphatase (c-di-AMP/oligoRNAs hydrolase)